MKKLVEEVGRSGQMGHGTDNYGYLVDEHVCRRGTMEILVQNMNS